MHDIRIYTVLINCFSSGRRPCTARDISSDRRVDVVIKKGSVVQDAVESSSSSNAFETEQHQKNLTSSTAQEEAADDLLGMDYTPARKKSPIHN